MKNSKDAELFVIPQNTAVPKELREEMDGVIRIASNRAIQVDLEKQADTESDYVAQKEEEEFNRIIEQASAVKKINKEKLQDRQFIEWPKENREELEGYLYFMERERKSQERKRQREEREMEREREEREREMEREREKEKQERERERHLQRPRLHRTQAAMLREFDDYLGRSSQGEGGS
ncbi:putative uncharacterized protein DDB_G0271982 [Centruroides vittatus]|uniref:putative uncharacterized protein DDB_G0271982 n=1 Tax=Centruroides vittatus TaxID=120091 RepID=UPI003510A058